MLFSNLSFIFIFLPILMFIYFLVSQKRKNIVLLLASLVFYAWGGPVYVVLLFLSTVFNYFCGRDLEEKKEDPMRKKRSLVFGIVINLLILGFFKYYVFLMESINALVSAELPYRELAVPIGISIYTLRAISYLADIYRGEAAQAKFVDLALYLGMFPQISAGPVDRYVNIAGQLGKRPLSVRRFGNGAMLFVCGLAKKVILADSAGILQEQITGLQIGTFSVLTAWIGCAAFAFRFYFELSGYADMAIGLGRMLGFDLQRNFYDPYASRSVTEFWKRWNSSLTLWVRAYIYEPLEKRVQEASGRIWIILLTAMLTGFWYGAEWKFLWWGIYFGILLVLEHFVFGRALARFPKVIQHLYTVITVFIGWTFFSAPDLGAALDYIGVMFGVGASAPADAQALYFIYSHWLLLLLCVAGASAKGMWALRSVSDVLASVCGKRASVCIVSIVVFMISLAFLITGTANAGLVIQF